MSEELRRSAEIRNSKGLHARAAAQFVGLTAGFKSDVTILKDGQSVNGKSIKTYVQELVVPKK